MDTKEALISKDGEVVVSAWSRVRSNSGRVANQVLDTSGEYAQITAKEKELFFGVALFCVGLLSFEHGKYCDGNAADYLSCTRPATYYYFDDMDITLVIAGIFFILLWVLKPVKTTKKTSREKAL